MTNITLLDGGMGQELIRRSGKPASPLWSTQVMIDQPGLVGEVHAAYADVGAKVATTNSYAIHRDRLRGGSSNHYAGAGVVLPDLSDRFEVLLTATLTEADTVRDRSRVAGAIGPLGASYRADMHPGDDVATTLYGEVAEILAPGCDMLLFETIPSVEVARSCLAAGRRTDRPVWLAFTVDDSDGTRLRSGEAVTDILAIAADADAALINCSVPEAIGPALDALAACDVPFGAYANGFEMISQAFIEGGTTAQGLTARGDLSPDTYADHAMGWLDHGATIIGGCCEVGPAHIAEIATRLRAAGHTLV